MDSPTGSDFTILGNPLYPIPCQFFELFQLASQQAELDWENFNALRKISNGLISLANASDPTVFPNILDTDPVLIQRLYRKLLHELHLLLEMCPEGQYKTLLGGALEKYSPKPMRQTNKRPSAQTDEALLEMDLSEFKTLVPFQSPKLTDHYSRTQKPEDDMSRLLDEYLSTKESKSKAFWEYLF